MDEVLRVVLLLAAVAASIAFMVWIMSLAKRETAARHAAWAAFAARHGFTFTPPHGPWYAKKPARIEGSVGTVPIAIDTYVVSNGKTSTMYTRLVSAAMQPMPLDAKVYRETIFGALGDLVGAQDVPVGDAQFDKEFVVKASREDLVRQWLHAPLRAAITRFFLGPDQSNGTLQYRQGQIVLSWLGGEKREGALHAAVSIAVEGAGFRGVEQGAFR
jgi:type II secretory pathway pseudopilin PulG